MIDRSSGLLTTLAFLIALQASTAWSAEPTIEAAQTDPEASKDIRLPATAAADAGDSSAKNPTTDTPKVIPETQAINQRNIGTALESFEPSEAISADNPVAFPVNI